MRKTDYNFKAPALPYPTNSYDQISQQEHNKIHDEELQLLNIQSKLNSLKEAEREHNEALNQFKEAEQAYNETLNQVKEAEQ